VRVATIMHIGTIHATTMKYTSALCDRLNNTVHVGTIGYNLQCVWQPSGTYNSTELVATIICWYSACGNHQVYRCKHLAYIRYISKVHAAIIRYFVPVRVTIISIKAQYIWHPSCLWHSTCRSHQVYRYSARVHVAAMRYIGTVYVATIRYNYVGTIHVAIIRYISTLRVATIR
jgi:hypothetical protein